MEQVRIILTGKKVKQSDFRMVASPLVRKRLRHGCLLTLLILEASPKHLLTTMQSVKDGKLISWKQTFSLSRLLENSCIIWRSEQTKISCSLNLALELVYLPHRVCLRTYSCTCRLVWACSCFPAKAFPLLLSLCPLLNLFFLIVNLPCPSPSSSDSDSVSSWHSDIHSTY